MFASFRRRSLAAAHIWLRIAASVAMLLLVAGCSSVGQLAGGPATDPNIPTPGQFGTGPRIVGVLAFEEPNNLSDGAPNSVYLAAKLAGSTLSGNPVTVLARTVAAGSANVAGVIGELEEAGASIIIGLEDEAAAVTVARAMVVRRAPTIAMTSFADLALQLYGAGFVPNEEAVALVNEAARRGYRSLAVVSTQGESSESFTKTVLSLAAAAGISARAVDGTTDSQFLAGMTAMAAAGVPVSAVVFASGPVRAAAMMSTLKGDQRFRSVAVVGNSGWSLTSKLPATLKGAWHTSIGSDGLKEFADKFRAVNGAAPTLNAAMVYDLVVLAAALPQAVGEEPYHPEVLTNSQGFKGFTGQFRFGPTGMLAARNYVIATVK